MPRKKKKAVSQEETPKVDEEKEKPEEKPEENKWVGKHSMGGEPIS